MCVCWLAKFVRKMMLNSGALNLIFGSAAIVFVTVAVHLAPLCMGSTGTDRIHSSLLFIISLCCEPFRDH